MSVPTKSNEHSAGFWGQEAKQCISLHAGTCNQGAEAVEPGTLVEVGFPIDAFKPRRTINHFNMQRKLMGHFVVEDFLLHKPINRDGLFYVERKQIPFSMPGAMLHFPRGSRDRLGLHWPLETLKQRLSGECSLLQHHRWMAYDMDLMTPIKKYVEVFFQSMWN